MNSKLALIHGWAIGSTIWQPVLQPLGSEAEVFVVDLPGYGGRSAEHAPSSLDDLADDLVKQIGPGSVWVAWSMGAIIAMHAAARHAESISGLVLIGATPKFSAANDWDPGMQPDAIGDLESRFQRDIDTALRRFIRLQFSDPRRDRAVIDRAIELTLEQPVPSLATLSAGLELLRQTDLRPETKLIKCPVTLIAGSHDAIVPPDATQELAAMIEQSEFHLLAAGHIPFLEQTAEVVRLIVEAAG